MLDFIWDNKEWLLSGIGVALISGMYFIIKRILNKNSKKKYYPFDLNLFKAKPLPSEILKQIEEVPPFQKTQKESFFIGLNIQWKCTYGFIVEQNENQIAIMLKSRGEIPWIFCSVSLEKYPEFKILKKNKLIWIAGKISCIESNVISLEVQNLTIC